MTSSVTRTLWSFFFSITSHFAFHKIDKTHKKLKLFFVLIIISWRVYYFKLKKQQDQALTESFDIKNIFFSATFFKLKRISILNTIKYFIYICLWTNKILKNTCTKFRQVCPQTADKVVRAKNTASRKSAGVRPALQHTPLKVGSRALTGLRLISKLST